MLMHKIALAGAAVVALTFAGSPASAFTHHPATPAEIQATDDLNAKALADARTGQTNQPTASVSPQPATSGTTATTPSPDMTAPMPSPAAPSATGNGGVATPDTGTAPPAPMPEQPEPAAATTPNGQ